MIKDLPPLEETRAYKELVAKGMAEGMEKGRKEGEIIGQILFIQEMKKIDKYSKDYLINLPLDKLTQILKTMKKGLID